MQRISSKDNIFLTGVNILIYKEELKLEKTTDRFKEIFNRIDFINHLALNMYDVLMLKKRISDVRLRKHHLWG